MRNLQQVRSALVAELGGTDRLAMINARVILRTGVNLQDIDPRQGQDAARVAKVLVALREMGFRMASGQDG
jgi:hypothetical protein